MRFSFCSKCFPSLCRVRWSNCKLLILPLIGRGRPPNQWMNNSFPQRRREADFHSPPDKMTTIYLHLVRFLISTSGLLITLSTAEISGFHSCLAFFPFLPTPTPILFRCTFKNPHPVSQVSFSVSLFSPPSYSLFLNKWGWRFEQRLLSGED